MKYKPLCFNLLELLKLEESHYLKSGSKLARAKYSVCKIIQRWTAIIRVKMNLAVMKQNKEKRCR